MLRLGKGDMEKGGKIIDNWNQNAIVPDGWNVDTDAIIKNWFAFANDMVLKEDKGNNVLIVTSNGIIRFAPYLTGDFPAFAKRHDIKVTTGGICIFEKDEDTPFWKCKEWNIKPYKS
jgi:probable phosphoglycerate mutase